MRPRNVLALLILLFIPSVVLSTTYFIATNGLDSQDGQEKTHTTGVTGPWLHAPGMPNFTGTYSCNNGDHFIFRGNDVWHFGNSGATPYAGGSWTWSCAGTSSGCDWDNGLTTTCTYIGVDFTYFSGASWGRPQFNYDNPISSVLVASCAFDQSTVVRGLEVTANYVTVDNFEFFGHCHSGVNPVDAYGGRSGLFDTLINSYFHGITMTNNGQPNGNTPMDQAPIWGGTTTPGTHSVEAFNVFDNSDGFCSSVGNCSAGPINLTDAYSFHDNVVRFLANGKNNPCNTIYDYDNLYEFMYESFDAADHGAVSSTYGSCQPAGTPMWFFNNIIRHTNIGVTIQRAATDNGNVYSFNNVWYDIGNSGNCFQNSNQVTADVSNYYHFNEVFDNSCDIRFTGGNPNPANGNVIFQNEQIIAQTTNVLPWSQDGGSTITQVDNGNELWQTEAVANGQGYVPGNGYAPTASNNSTVGAGGNLTIFCNGLTFAVAAAACKKSNATVGYDSVNHKVIPATPNARPSSGAWDIGPYLFSTAQVPNPAPAVPMMALRTQNEKEREQSQIFTNQVQ